MLPTPRKSLSSDGTYEFGGNRSAVSTNGRGQLAGTYSSSSFIPQKVHPNPHPPSSHSSASSSHVYSTSAVRSASTGEPIRRCSASNRYVVATMPRSMEMSWTEPTAYERVGFRAYFLHFSTHFLDQKIKPLMANWTDRSYHDLIRASSVLHSSQFDHFTIWAIVFQMFSSLH